MFDIPNLLLANWLSEIEQKHDGNNADMMNEVFDTIDKAENKDEDEEESQKDEPQKDEPQKDEPQKDEPQKDEPQEDE